MGYRSDVRIIMKKKDYPKFTKYVNDYIAEKNTKYNLLKDMQLIEKRTNTIYIGWDYMKWYDECPEVQAVMNALDKFEEEGLSYTYGRMGEDYDDYEEKHSHLDLPFPQIVRHFDDDNTICELD